MKILLVLLAWLLLEISPSRADAPQPRPSVRAQAEKQDPSSSRPESSTQKENLPEDRGPASNGSDGLSEEMVQYLDKSGKRVETIFENSRRE